LILKKEFKSADGFSAHNQNNINSVLGKEGIAITNLRPSGTAEFEGIKYDVITEGEFISFGSAVRVLRTVKSKIIVSALNPE